MTWRTLVMTLLLATPVMTSAQGRLVSAGGALTEIVLALGAADDLVGVDSTSAWPHGAHRVGNIGYVRSLSAEGIASLKPSQVIASEDAGPPAVLQQLRTLGIPVTVLPSDHRIEGVLSRIRLIGQLTGQKIRAAQLIARVSHEWARTRAAVARPRKGAPPRVLFILTHAPNLMLAAGQGTAADAMLGYAGARNAMPTLQGYQALTPEAIVAAQPDVIVLSRQGLRIQGGIDALLKNAGLGLTPAGKKRRVIALDEMSLLGFGPSMPAAVTELDSALRAASGS